MNAGLAGLLILALMLSGCGGQQPPPDQDLSEEVEIRFPDRSPYKISIGDDLDIRFFYYPMYNVGVTVRPDGMVTIPLMGDVKAEGLEPTELRDMIRGRYAQVVAEPEVSVIVSDIADQRVFVFGEVREPGAFDLAGNATVVDLIAEAGGPTYVGRTDSIILIRRAAGGGFVGERINVKEIMENGGRDNVYLVGGDVIYVPMSFVGKVDLFVEQFFARISPMWYFYIAGREVLNPGGDYIFGQ